MLYLSLSSCLLQVFESEMDAVWMESAYIRFTIVYHLSCGFEFLRISNTNVQREPSEERYMTLTVIYNVFFM